MIGIQKWGYITAFIHSSFEQEDLMMYDDLLKILWLFFTKKIFILSVMLKNVCFLTIVAFKWWQYVLYIFYFYFKGAACNLL